MLAVLDKILRNGFLLAILVTVMLTSASKALTQAVMLEIAGYAALAVVIANFTVYAYTSKKFLSREGGSERVIASIILGAFLLVGLCVLGIYFAKVDGITTNLPSL